MYPITVLMTFDSRSLAALLPVLLAVWTADFSLHLLSVIASAGNSDKTQVFSNYKVFYHDIFKDSFFWSLNLSDIQLYIPALKASSLIIPSPFASPLNCLSFLVDKGVYYPNIWLHLALTLRYSVLEYYLLYHSLFIVALGCWNQVASTIRWGLLLYICLYRHY